MTSENSTSVISIKKKTGEDCSLCLEKLDLCISQLKEYATVKIKKLPKEQKRNWEYFMECIDNTEGTTNYFYITEKVKQYFSDGIQYKRGTVGAYCGGCFLSTNHCNNSCTPSCVTAFLPKGVKGSITCQALCIIIEKNGSFTVLNEYIKDTDRCYLYVETSINVKETDKILTDKLKRYLNERSIKKYNIMEYKEDDPNSYRPILGNGFVDLLIEEKHKKKCNLTWLWVLLVVIIFLIALFFIFVGVLAYSKRD